MCQSHHEKSTTYIKYIFFYSSLQLTSDASLQMVTAMETMKILIIRNAT